MSTGGGDDFHLLDRVAAFYRHRRLIVSVLTIIVTLMMLQSYSTIPMYQATARVLIEDERLVMVAGMGSSDPIFWVDPEPYYETQYRILQSPGLARYTVQQIDLSTVSEFTGEAPRQFGPLEAIRAARATVFGWAQTIGTSVLGVIRPDAVEPPAAQIGAQDDEMLALSAAESTQIENFVIRVTVSPVVNTRLVDVTFTSADPVFAAEAVNAHAETYVQRNLDRRLETVQQTLEWVTGELATQRTAVEASDRALADYRESQDALSLNTGTDIVTTRLAALNDQVTKAQTNRLQREVLYTQVADLDPGQRRGGDVSGGSAVTKRDADHGASHPARCGKGPAVQSLRRAAPRDHHDQHRNRGRAAPGPNRGTARNSGDQERLRLGGR